MPDTPAIKPLSKPANVLRLKVGDSVNVYENDFKILGFDGPFLHLVGPKDLSILPTETPEE